MTWVLPSPLRRARIARRAEAAAQPKPAAATAASAAGAQAALPTLRDWLGVLAMVVGLFMAIIDVQIVASSLTLRSSASRLSTGSLWGEASALSWLARGRVRTYASFSSAVSRVTGPSIRTCRPSGSQ